MTIGACIVTIYYDLNRHCEGTLLQPESMANARFHHFDGKERKQCDRLELCRQIVINNASPTISQKKCEKTAVICLM